MKKIITIVIFVMTLCASTLVGTTHAQTLNLSITQIEAGSNVSYCEILYDSISFSKDPNCNDPGIHWRVTYRPDFTTFDYYADNITIPFNNTYESVLIEYWGCDIDDMWFLVYPLSFENVQEPWTEDTRWLALGETLELEVSYSPTLNYLWPDNSTGWNYTITEPEMSGYVWCLMYNNCGSVSDTIGIYYNPEPETVSVDPYTGHIIVSWNINPTMSTYLEYIDIYRDGFPTPITRVPYSAGQYIDEAVDGNTASRYYAFKGVTYDGSVCEWYSDAKPSIHSDYTLGAVSDDIIILFNDVSNKYKDLYVYYISELDGDEVHHIDSLGVRRRRDGTIDIVFNSNNRFTVNRDGTIQYRAPSYYFDPDHFLIIDSGFLQGEKRDDRKLRSNKSEGTVSVKTFETVKCSIFPNPARHQFTVSGIEMGTITLYNGLGQVILTQEISGETTIGVNSLPPGIYFAKISAPWGACTEQVVVE